MTTRLWQAGDRAHVATLAVGPRNAQALTWLGSRVAVLAADGFLGMLPCEVCRSTDGLLALARARRARQLTRAERAKYLHEPAPPG